MRRVPLHARMPHLGYRNGPGLKGQFKDVHALGHRLIKEVQRRYHSNQVGGQRYGYAVGNPGTTLAIFRFIPRSASASSTDPCNAPSGDATTWPQAT